jgi:hypothetical protein
MKDVSSQPWKIFQTPSTLDYIGRSPYQTTRPFQAMCPFVHRMTRTFIHLSTFASQTNSSRGTCPYLSMCSPQLTHFFMFTWVPMPSLCPLLVCFLTSIHSSFHWFTSLGTMHAQGIRAPQVKSLVHSVGHACL